MTPSQIARQYIGETEKPRNSGFNSSVFATKMESVGFVKSHAWCAYFAELCFKEAYPDKFVSLDYLFSASTIATFRNFKRAGYKISRIPSIDALVIWQTYRHGLPMATGHAGIVSAVKDSWQFSSIEGNTSDAKSREGYTVAEHSRKVFAEVKNGLHVLGFITI